MWSCLAWLCLIFFCSLTLTLSFSSFFLLFVFRIFLLLLSSFHPFLLFLFLLFISFLFHFSFSFFRAFFLPFFLFFVSFCLSVCSISFFLSLFGFRSFVSSFYFFKLKLRSFVSEVFFIPGWIFFRFLLALCKPFLSSSSSSLPDPSIARSSIPFRKSQTDETISCDRRGYSNSEALRTFNYCIQSTITWLRKTLNQPNHTYNQHTPIWNNCHMNAAAWVISAACYETRTVTI